MDNFNPLVSCLFWSHRDVTSNWSLSDDDPVMTSVSSLCVSAVVTDNDDEVV